jgi:SAM-dependent methyltransferase
MSGFSAAWLALREPYDRAARNGAVLDAVAVAFADAPATKVTDLGCGTGATVRALAPHLPARQNWRLVDNDEALLEQASREGAATAPAGAGVTTVAADLAADLTGALAPVLDDCDLVTTSALLDLVSANWLDHLVALLSRLSRPFYAALSYDGAVALLPGSRHDNDVIAAVNRHQRTDKGFGPALGPDAARIAPERLRAAGFFVTQGRSDWRLDVDDRAIQTEILAGWARAAQDIGFDPAIITRWLGERRDHVAAGRSQMMVGHIDFFATPSVRR